MSILRILSLKKFGIYKIFNWNENCPDFRKFNLIYGWNAAGKTTLSRVFTSLEKKEVCAYHDGAEFKIKLDDLRVVDSNNLSDLNLRIRVFNCDFIEENIFFDKADNNFNPIIYISEEDIDAQAELKKLKILDENLELNFKEAQKTVTLKERDKENFLTQTAALIKAAVGDYGVRDEYYSYNKTLLIKKIDKDGIEGFKLLPDGEIQKLREVVFGEAKAKIDLIPKLSITLVYQNHTFTSINDLVTVCKSLLSKEIKGKIMDRLKNDSDLNKWVAVGVMLYKDRPKTHCLFCEKPLEEGFYESLMGHFSKSYNDFMAELKAIEVIVKGFSAEHDLSGIYDLYPDLKDDFVQAVNAFNGVKKEFQDWLLEVLNKIEEKKSNPFKALELPQMRGDLVDDYYAALDVINQVIEKHNLRTTNHQEEATNAKNSITSDIIATAIEKEGYIELLKTLGESLKALELSKASYESNKTRIKELEEKNSNIGTAVIEINKHLVEFFGRTEIQLVLVEGDSGYLIKRGEHTATNLSESERTAIAFAYFLTKAREKDSKISDTIIVLDDPISSFDSQFTFHCFSTIKNYFGGAEQLFISTHNFELFSLVKDWFMGKENYEDKCGFYMIENQNKDGGRHALISELESTLKNHKSEYHYLFFLLQDFLKKEPIEYNDLYVIGNIARRFLEVFVNFKIPNKTELKDKINALKLQTVSVTEIDKLFKLTNEYSHQKNPLTMMQHQDKLECKDAVKILFRVLQEADDKHLNSLKQLVPQ